jgi:molybdopterin molybdotransferase
MTIPANHNVEWDEARQIAYENSTETAAEEISIIESIGRICAQDVIAQSDLPPAHTAMMDGYAVAGTGPWKIIKSIRAGQFESEIEPGTALKVSTGAHIPAECSFVIPHEDVVIFENDVASNVPLPMGKHIRVPGDEARVGDIIVSTGSTITPVVAGLAASSSIDTVQVRKIPQIDVLVTGDELVSNGHAEPGKIRDSLSIQIPSWVTGLGGQIGQITRVRDDVDETREAIISCLAPIIITTGGTAHGEFDCVRKALSQLDAVLIVDEIKMRPGHPSVLAKLPSGQLVASLPGNPLAALVSYLTLVAPAINRLLGQPLGKLDTAELRQDFPTDRTRIVPVKIQDGKVLLTEFRGSAMLRGLTEADALAVINPTDSAFGSRVRILAFPWK